MAGSELATPRISTSDEPPVGALVLDAPGLVGGNARFSAHTTVGDRPFASYRGRAQGGVAQLEAHSYGAAIPTGRWNWKISVGGKERAKAEVTLVASCP